MHQTSPHRRRARGPRVSRLLAGTAVFLGYLFVLSALSLPAAATGTLTFSPDKGAPGTLVSGSESPQTDLSCVNQVTFSSDTVSAVAPFVSNDGSNVIFRVPDLGYGLYGVTFSSTSNSTCMFANKFQVVSPLRITSVSLPDAGYGVPYTARITAAGGVGPYSWAVISGAPPDGVVLNPNGVFSGAPLSVAPATLTAQVMDKYGATATATFTITIEAPPQITVSSLPAGTVGVAYSLRLSAQGGVPPYNWGVGPSGGLPGGLVVNSAGVLSGRPGTPGTSMLDLQVTDGVGVTGSLTLPITIEPVPEVYAVAIADGALPVGSPPQSDPMLLVHSPRGGVVGLAPGPPGRGFWALTGSGRVRGVSGLRSLGSLPKLRRGERPVAIAANPAGDGYWLLTSRGRVFAFGRARLYPLEGRQAARTRSAKAVGIAAAPGGSGYWVLWSDGEVEAFGGAPVFGSPQIPRHRFTAIAASADGPGYWVVSASGRVFPFGSAWGEPPTGGIPIHGVVVGIAGAPDGAGYWLVGRNGAIRAFGSARLASDLPNPLTLGRAVAVAATP
jgi:hypothetical protein